jgi:hypothetical protein
LRSRFLASKRLILNRIHKSVDLHGHEINQKQGPQSWEANTRLASFIDADRLTDRQLKLSGPGVHSIHASSFSHSSVKDLETPGPIKLAMELMKLFNSRSGSETGLRSIAGPFSIDS